MVGIILTMDWRLIARGLTLWRHLTAVRKRWCPESSWLRIVLVPLTKWGFVTWIGLDWSWIGIGLADCSGTDIGSAD